MAMRCALLLLALVSASPALAQRPPSQLPILPSLSNEDRFTLGKSNFALPVIDYRAPDGTWKRSSGIIVGHEISPNATVGLGFFSIKPKYQESFTPQSGKSRKVAVGLSFKF